MSSGVHASVHQSPTHESVHQSPTMRLSISHPPWIAMISIASPCVSIECDCVHVSVRQPPTMNRNVLAVRRNTGRFVHRVLQLPEGGV
jgi:hypothetical protein